jgi:hypothetical protein
MHCFAVVMEDRKTSRKEGRREGRQESWKTGSQGYRRTEMQEGRAKKQKAGQGSRGQEDSWAGGQ